MRTRNGSWLVFDIAKPLANALKKLFPPLTFYPIPGANRPRQKPPRRLGRWAHGIEIDFASLIRFTCATSATARRFSHRAEKALRTAPQETPPRRPSPSRTRLDLGASAATPHTFVKRLVATRAMEHQKVAPGAHLTPFARLSFPWRLQHDKSAPAPLTGHQRALLLSGASTDD